MRIQREIRFTGVGDTAGGLFQQSARTDARCGHVDQKNTESTRLVYNSPPSRLTKRFQSPSSVLMNEQGHPIIKFYIC